jgi:diaminohydroxyphosphoribosylaminopyrimidine deaminase/5-amino-6-(5-phosphoribosylamino)uracil reductase
MQRQRAWVDAIMVGAETVRVDDPALTARGALRIRPLTRVVVDWRARTPPESRVWASLSSGPVIMVVLDSTVEGNPSRFEALRATGVRVLSYPTRDCAAIARSLAAEGVQSILLEGGPALQQAWLEAGLVDHVQWLVTPATLDDGVPMVTAVRVRCDAMGPEARRGLGDDRLIEGPWKDF